MSNFSFSRSSLAKLGGVHPDLIKLVKSALAVSSIDFGITEGLRSKEKEKQMVAQGKSETLHSRHLTGHAVDVVAYINGKISWNWQEYEKINDAMEEASKETGIPFEWGGNWKTLKDGAHFQLPWKEYPA